MKKIVVFALAAALCSCQSNKFAITGTTEGFDGTLYLLDEQENLLDSTVVADGAFRFDGKVEAPGIRYIVDSYTDAPTTFAAMLFLEPGTITIADNAENPAGRKVVTGTPANDASAAYAEASKGLLGDYRQVETTDERRAAIEKEYDQLTRTTLENNRDNYFGIVILAQQLAYELSGQELLDEIAKFSPALQQTELLTKLKENAEQRLKTDIGQAYIDIEQPAADGTVVSLKSVIENPANKYTLVDFWASWCGPCMGEVPVLLKSYEEFHPKGFEIYGVSFDQKREDWTEAIEEHQMNWIHVAEFNGFQNQAARDYGIQAIPSNFLIDAEGKIIAKNLRGEALYEKIAELLAE